MNDPLRLRESGGVSGRLLDSASLDRPNQASRLRALELAATAGAFVTTTAGVTAAATSSSASALYKSVAMRICIGAVAGGAIAFIGSSLFDAPADFGASAARPTAAPLVVPEPAALPAAEQPSDIAAEPTPARAKAPSPARIIATPPVPSAESPSPAPPPIVASVPQTEREKEAGALANAREAVARGDTAGAIRALDNYDATHPSGSLRAESAALRQSVTNMGKSGIKREPMTNSSGAASAPK